MIDKIILENKAEESRDLASKISQFEEKKKNIDKEIQSMLSDNNLKSFDTDRFEVKIVERTSYDHLMSADQVAKVQDLKDRAKLTKDQFIGEIKLKNAEPKVASSYVKIKEKQVSE